MRGAERVVDVDVAELRRASCRGERLGSSSASSPRVEAEVLEQAAPARLERRGGLLRPRADAVVGERDGSRRGAPRARAATGSSEILRAACPSAGRGAHARMTLAPCPSSVADRRQRRADARVVGDRAAVLVERDVEVDAHEDALARGGREVCLDGLELRSRSSGSRSWPRDSRRPSSRTSASRSTHAVREAPLVVVPGRRPWRSLSPRSTWRQRRVEDARSAGRR